jgi:alkylation response protein AidB-like acyl-CoA dehydrogenase
LVITDDMRLDEVGKGWTVAMTTLLYERGAAEGAGAGGGMSMDERLSKLIALAKRMRRGGEAAWQDPTIRDSIMKLAVRIEGMRQGARRARVEGLTDHPMRLPLQGKLLVSELLQDIAAVAMEIEGAHASLYQGDERAPDEGAWPLAYLNSYGFTIAAGTSEVQKNILGERVLGLPKSK